MTEEPKECVLCGATEGILYPETWTGVRFRSRRLLLPCCATCREDDQLVNRLTTAFGLRKRRSRLDLSPEALLGRYTYFSTLQKAIEEADAWAAADNRHIQDAFSPVDAALIKASDATFFQPANRDTWPAYDGRAPCWLPGDVTVSSRIESLARDANALLVSGRDSLPILVALCGRIACIENLGRTLEEAEGAVCQARRFLENPNAAGECVLCRSAREPLAEVPAVIGRRLPPRMLDVPGLLRSTDLGRRYGLPNLTKAEEAMHKVAPALVGRADVRAGLFAQFKIASWSITLGCAMLLAGVPAVVRVCRFCACAPLVSLPARLEKAFAVGEGLWAVPPARFAAGALQPEFQYPDSELRAFDRAIDPTC